ncbi:MAG: cytochrome C [Acidobacteria bacterium]|nr:MAG: cytochrome C [Acidobacteriota bacterium]
MPTLVDRVLGPRIPHEELHRDPLRFRLPTILLLTASLLLVASVFLPYWQMTLLAPQYPGGLRVNAYLNRLEGDVHEIDELNHYIGMRPLQDAAMLERSISVYGVVMLSLLVAGAVFVHSRWAGVLSLPALIFPAVFLGDLYYWLRTFGHELDPRAPLSRAIKPFTPPVLGVGRVGQFKTVAIPGAGLWLAFAASLLIAAGLYYHRRAYKPLVERALAAGRT